MEILGVPETDEPRMLMLTQELFGATDPELNRSGAEAVPGDISSIKEVLADSISTSRRSAPIAAPVPATISQRSLQPARSMDDSSPNSRR
jgi:hypothetical protein